MLAVILTTTMFALEPRNCRLLPFSSNLHSLALHRSRLCNTENLISDLRRYFAPLNDLLPRIEAFPSPMSIASHFATPSGDHGNGSLDVVPEEVGGGPSLLSIQSRSRVVSLIAAPNSSPDTAVSSYAANSSSKRS